nr:hypothetical protein [Halorubrum sp. C191]
MPELENILQSRADIVIVADTVGEGVLNFCAALAARDSGGTRQALYLLRLAGEIAENEGVDAIERTHLESARSRLKQKHVEEGIRSNHVRRTV